MPARMPDGFLGAGRAFLARVMQTLLWRLFSMQQVAWIRRQLVILSLVAMALFLGAQAIGAQDSGTKTESKTKVTIKDGKNVKVTGCVTRSQTGALTLTAVADKKSSLPDYILVLDDYQEKDLEKEIGHQVQVEGKAANQGDGKVKFEVEEKTKGTSGDEHKTERSAEMSGDLKLPLLGVKSFKMIAGACPGQ